MHEDVWRGDRGRRGEGRGGGGRRGEGGGEGRGGEGRGGEGKGEGREFGDNKMEPCIIMCKALCFFELGVIETMCDYTVLDVPGYCQLRATSCMPQFHMGMGS